MPNCFISLRRWLVGGTGSADKLQEAPPRAASLEFSDSVDSIFPPPPPDPSDPFSTPARSSSAHKLFAADVPPAEPQLDSFISAFDDTDGLVNLRTLGDVCSHIETVDELHLSEE